jgi:hypothetical protein
MRDLGAGLTVTKNIVVAAKTTGTLLGAAFDTAPYDGVTAILHVETWTDGTHTPSLMECATSGGSYTAVAAADLIGAFTAITANGSPGTKQKVTYVGKLQFVKVQIVSAGTTTGAILGADIIGGFGRKLPQA